MTLPWLQERIERLVRRLQQKSMHHGVILSGAQGIGKAELAVTMAQTILCKEPSAQGPCGQCQSCQLFAANTHPDFHVIESEKQIGVDQIRSAIGKLSGTAQLGGNKGLIIYAADSMTEAAANALLKTLEEPTQSTYLILVTSQLNQLLPTILSRCEKQHIATPSAADSLAWLATQGINSLDETSLQAYGGAPLLAKAAIEGDGITYGDFHDGVMSLRAGDVTAVNLAEKWQSDAVQITNWCQLLLKKEMTGAIDTPAYSRYQQCIMTAQKLAHPGVNKVLILTTLLGVMSHS